MDKEGMEKDVLRMDLSGHQKSKWRVRIKASLVRALRRAADQIAETKINPNTGETVASEASKLTTKGFEALESQLDRQTIENQLKQAQIQNTYEEKENLRVQRKKTKAETRKLNADSASQELANFEKAIKIIQQFEKQSSKKLTFRIEGKRGQEVIFLPKDVVGYLAERLDENKNTYDGE